MKKLLAALSGLFALAAAPASAQNGFSFLDAGKTAIDYRVATASPQRACAELARMPGRDLTILSAELVAASESAPAHCRVLGVIQPEIRFEVALPEKWNRRLFMRGNGGFAGEDILSAPRLVLRNAALRNGFVAVQTNTGHDARTEPGASFALSLQKTLDYSFRAVHATAEAGKRIARAYYDRPVAFSYFDGCSAGGRQAMVSAQRHPGDFDGIIAGAPIQNFTDTMMWFAWTTKAFAKAPIALEKMSLVAEKVYAKCDAKDGIEDGIIDDPRQCSFNPAADLPRCAGNQDAANCFTDGQIATLEAVYNPMKIQGKPHFFGQPVSAEKPGRAAFGHEGPVTGWIDWLIAKSGRTLHLNFAENFMRYAAFMPAAADPSYDLSKFDFDKDPARLAMARQMFDATNPDLAEFKARGGKLLMYFGWADTALNPLMGIDYYEKVTARMGADTRDWFRLFMVPGMFHCRGGVGVDRFDALSALVDWVEGGKAPNRIVGSHVEGTRTVRSRPLCPYPQVARHNGSGSTDDAANFTCKNPQ